MPTIRTHKDKNFSTINNTGLTDRRLSWAARGLLAYLLSKPDHWKVRVSHLVNEYQPEPEDGEPRQRQPKGTGEKFIYSLLAELKRYGYVAYVRLSTGGGIYEVYESPEMMNRENQAQTLKLA